MAGPEFDSGSETQSSFSVGMWLVSPIVGTSSLLGGGGGAEEDWSWPLAYAADEKQYELFGKGKSSPTSAG